MAGAKVEIQVDDAQVKAALVRAEQGLAPDGFKSLLGRIGEHLLRTTRERAATETGPDGEAWPALSPRYERRKVKVKPGLPMLKFDNHMLGNMLDYQIGDDGALYVGTNAPYGATHQFGRDAIPARPWLGVSPEDSDWIKQTTLDYLRSILDGGEAPEPPAA